MNVKQRLDELKFLHERRMILFNTRRDHEWKIFFGTIGLLLAMDATLIAKQPRVEDFVLGSIIYTLWVVMIAALSCCCAYYERELQKRNLADRQAMNKINNIVCGALSFDEHDNTWEADRSVSESLWSFNAQMAFLIVVGLLSAALPLGIELTRKPVTLTNPHAPRFTRVSGERGDAPPQSAHASLCPGNSCNI
ncbi:MAG TPA: hypothetical protein VKR52_04530 [Terracidiphilus sp.]|nr:hypothetical protein [Terracidiphilus sp.]